jgi:hypothetical protein
MPQAPKIRRRWYQFGLGTILTVIIVLSIPLAWVARERGKSLREQRIADQLRERGFKTVMLAGPYDSWALELIHKSPPQGWWRDFARLLLGKRILLVYDPPPDFSDLTLLAGLTNLQGLHVNSPPVSDISPLSGFPKLVVLVLKGADVSDLTPLAGLKNLEVLHIGGGAVNDLSPLAGLHKLRMLWLHSTNVSDLTPLAGLTILETFVARFEPIPLSQLEFLQEALPNCRVSNDRFAIELLKIRIRKP